MGGVYRLRQRVQPWGAGAVVPRGLWGQGALGMRAGAGSVCQARAQARTEGHGTGLPAPGLPCSRGCAGQGGSWRCTGVGGWQRGEKAACAEACQGLVPTGPAAGKALCFARGEVCAHRRIWERGAGSPPQAARGQGRAGTQRRCCQPPRCPPGSSSRWAPATQTPPAGPAAPRPRW